MKNIFENTNAKQWGKAAIACLIYVLFIAWVGNFWWLFLLPVIFDIFTSKLIPWTWWKKTKNKALYTFFSWVDAILFALIAVYFINLFLFQNYKIPTSSLEKTLLVGDFLLVSKVSYGPRVPMTPLSFPLAQHTLPVLNTKSYLEQPKWDYKRLIGIDTIKALDIVVFNFPNGDTVATSVPNPDYYSLCSMYGREAVNNNKKQFGEVVYRPADRRENYVKRCVGLPGDSLQIIDKQVYINNIAQKEPAGIQQNYLIETDGRKISDKQFDALGVSLDDRSLVNNWRDANRILAYLKYPADSLTTNFAPIFYCPLTKTALKLAKGFPNVKSIKADPNLFRRPTFPAAYTAWDRDNYGPIYIPRKGATTHLNINNLPLYERIIKNYEGNKLAVKAGKIYINDTETDSYTFQMNYYWMMGDNRHNSEDSRFWGFVPEDHIVGKPILVWLSLDPDAGNIFSSIRWKRLFTLVDNIQ